MVKVFYRFVLRFRVAIGAGMMAVAIAMAMSASGIWKEDYAVEAYPLDHPYVETFLTWGHQFAGSDRLVAMIATREDTIFTKENLLKIRKVHRAVERVPGVWKSQVTSLALVIDAWEANHKRSWEGTEREVKEIRDAVLRDFARRRLMVSTDERAALLTTTFLRQDLDAPAIYLAVHGIVEEHTDRKTSIHVIGREVLRGEMLTRAGLPGN